MAYPIVSTRTRPIDINARLSAGIEGAGSAVAGSLAGRAEMRHEGAMLDRRLAAEQAMHKAGIAADVKAAEADAAHEIKLENIRSRSALERVRLQTDAQRDVTGASALREQRLLAGQQRAMADDIVERMLARPNIAQTHEIDAELRRQGIPRDVMSSNEIHSLFMNRLEATREKTAEERLDELIESGVSRERAAEIMRREGYISGGGR